MESLPQYMSKQNKNGNTYYRIRKNYQGKQYQIFQSPDKETTLQVYKECTQARWNQEAILNIQKKYRKNRPILRNTQYITRDDHGGYRIQKWDKGRVKYYGKTSTLKHAQQIRDHLINKGWKKPAYQKQEASPTRYIIRQPSGHYKIKYKQKHYGTYHTYKEAIKARKKLIQHEWDETLQLGHKIEDNPHRYITTQEEKYVIKKVINGKIEYYGIYNTLEEAIQERDFYESINWDWNLLDLY